MSELVISDREFNLIRDLMRDVAGVDLNDSKKPLVSGRLAGRLRERQLGSFADYWQLISSGRDSDEFQRMLDLLTTHETYFFREPRHFEQLVQHMLPSLPRGQEVRVWSAASSTGEEAYSLAMVLMDKLGSQQAWRVFASDISLGVVERARKGVYSLERTTGLSDDYRRRFCLRGVGRQAGSLQVAPEIRERVHFAQINLNKPLGNVGDFDVIFLRNVMIYFDLETKRRIVARVAAQLRPHGWLVVGHSESLNGVSNDLRMVAPTLYRRVTP